MIEDLFLIAAFGPIMAAAVAGIAIEVSARHPVVGVVLVTLSALMALASCLAVEAYPYVASTSACIGIIMLVMVLIERANMNRGRTLR